jgi:anti-sigma factor ChrR (cupin superfamily)
VFNTPTKLSDAEVKRQGNKHVEFQQKWFFSGLKNEDMPTAKDGIDFNDAMRHLGAIQGSFEPKHEHKQAAVAFLASKWLDLK